ncbi:MAG: prepilin-type N-terminal cleavage/methylation domain-containing protein [Nitrospinae bacterium]|nr:prepilin-type N-terminal cleavage/methylation domain-containing protein [Nitrospinota bacterium]
MTSGGGRQGGFTLIELVIAMSLLAAMAAILTGGLSLSLRSWEAGKERMEEHHDLTEGFLMLEGQVRMARTAFWLNEKNERTPVFSGKPEEIVFAAGYPRLVPLGEAEGWYLQKIAFNPERSSIVYAESWFQPAMEPEKVRWTKTEIGKGRIKSLHLEYLVQVEPGKFAWTTSIADEKRADPARLPKSVRITAETEAEKDGFAWPPMEVEITEGATTARQENKP